MAAGLPRFLFRRAIPGAGGADEGVGSLREKEGDGLGCDGCGVILGGMGIKRRTATVVSASICSSEASSVDFSVFTMTTCFGTMRRIFLGGATGTGVGLSMMGLVSTGDAS